MGWPVTELEARMELRNQWQMILYKLVWCFFVVDSIENFCLIVGGGDGGGFSGYEMEFRALFG